MLCIVILMVVALKCRQTIGLVPITYGQLRYYVCYQQFNSINYGETIENINSYHILATFSINQEHKATLIPHLNKQLFITLEQF